jgi:hypothetical protein
MYYTRLGDHAHALECLERAFAAHSGDLLYIKAEPAFASLRAEPRFQSLCRRIGIP